MGVVVDRRGGVGVSCFCPCLCALLCLILSPQLCFAVWFFLILYFLARVFVALLGLYFVCCYFRLSLSCFYLSHLDVDLFVGFYILLFLAHFHIWLFFFFFFVKFI